MAKLLEVNNLTTRFYTEDGIVHAVNGISFELDEGESMAIVGESGSGKSVAMKSMMGIIPSPPGRVEAGEVMFNGRDLLKLSPDEMRNVRGREMAMIFQDPMTSLNPVLTVGTQMTEALVLHLGMKQEQADARAAELLTLVGVANAADRLKDYPHQFSGGQRQRIGIAMALSCNPSLLIADEPTTALDVTIQAQIVDLVLRLKQQLGMAIIWITHDLGVIAGMVDRIIVMYAGFIVENAPVRALYKETAHPYAVGLLESLPKIDARRKERLIPIKGLPPDLLKEPTRCPFAPRCPYNIERCWEENPPLKAVAPDHYAACWRAEEVHAGLRIHDIEQLEAINHEALAALAEVV
jgi:oligopeptide transport system ATP-binding protein